MMDTTTIRELVIAAKQMEEILDRNGVNRPDLWWIERIAAAELALAIEETILPSVTTITCAEGMAIAEALSLADELSREAASLIMVVFGTGKLIYPTRKKVREIEKLAHEYRAKRGLE